MKRIDLLFEDFPDTPVSAVVSPVPMGAYFDFLETWTTTLSITDFRACLDVAQRLASFEPALLDLDYNLVRAVVTAWLEAVREVPPPLPAAPSERRPSPEPSSATPARRSGRRRNS